MALFLSEQQLEDRQEKMFLQAVNEVYFGRTPGINSLFNAYCDWREPLVSKTKYFTATPKNMYNKEMEFFRKKVCEQFGFKSFSYNIIPSGRVNSFTFGQIIPTRTPDKIEVTKEGYRYKKDANISSIIAVYPDLVFGPQYTNEENFAILLHEIGHNFQSALNHTILSLNAATGVFQLLIDFLRYGPLEPAVNLMWSSETIKDSTNKFLNSVSSNKVIGCIYSVTSVLLYTLSTFKNLVFGLMRVTMAPINLIINALYRLLPFMLELLTGNAQLGYYEERFSDGFAASYGFGEPLITALSKMGGKVNSSAIVNDIITNIPIVGHLYTAACIPGFLLWSLIDVHPSFEDRAMSIVKDLKTDLNDPSTPPQMKAQLKKEIDNYEKAMDTYFKESKKISNPKMIPAILQEFIYKKCGGGIKFKISELPYKHGFRSDTNKVTNSIIDGDYDNKSIINTKII